MLSRTFIALPTFMLTLWAAAAAEKNLVPEVITSQDAINAGEVPLSTLFYRGAHLFTNPFTPADGLGEAPDGPRRSVQSLAGAGPFLRINGLDATSCVECHGTLGFQRQPDGLRLPAEPGAVGGFGGIVAVSLQFPDPSNLSEGFVRVPPHLFGIGYLQRLGDEMTLELRARLRDLAIEAAETDTDIRAPLTAKGVSFGFVSVSRSGQVNLSEVEGISSDMVVRPFQAKGLTSSLRVFIGGALNFHLGIQAHERLERGFISNDNPSGALPDDPLFELMEGEVTSLTTFTAALRPPIELPHEGREEETERGRSLFTAVGCADCHTPSLRIDDPRLTILDPRLLDPNNRPPGYKNQYVSIFDKTAFPDVIPITGTVPSSDWLPIVQQDWMLSGGKGIGSAQNPDRLAGLTFSLSDERLPYEAKPRLAAQEDNGIIVPLYSDLRRHRMGSGLAAFAPQETEVKSITVPADQYRTAPLWGVGDRSVFLHDGRARTLDEAIRLHSGEASEANHSVGLYEALTQDEQEDLLWFLRSLRLPSAHYPMSSVRGNAEGLSAH